MKKIIIIIVALVISLPVFSQIGDLFRFNSGGLIMVQWDMAKPTGAMTDFVENTSFSGISVDYRHCYKNNFILGGRAGWNGFYENAGLTDVENGNSTIYNRLENKTNVAPILFVVDYMFRSDKFIPYIGFGIGGYFINSSVSSDIIGTLYTNSFHFGVSPEVGITIPFIISNFGLNISTRYNIAVATSKASQYSWIDFNIGLSFMY